MAATREQLARALLALKEFNYDPILKARLKKCILSDDLETEIPSDPIIGRFYHHYIPWILPKHPREQKKTFTEIVELHHPPVHQNLQMRLQSTQKAFLTHLQMLKKGIFIEKVKISNVAMQSMKIQLSPNGHMLLFQSTSADQWQFQLTELQWITIGQIANYFVTFSFDKMHQVVLWVEKLEQLLPFTTCVEGIRCTLRKETSKNLVHSAARLRIQELAQIYGVYQAVSIVQEKLQQLKVSTFPLRVDDETSLDVSGY